MNSMDIMTEIRATLDDLKAERIDTETARARGALLKTAAKMASVALEHAKATNRLETGSGDLPGFVMSEAKPKKVR